MQVSVTGYSLGGHLATIFTELHPSEVIHTYLFNAAGRGTLDATMPSLGQLIGAYDAILGDPAEAYGRGLISGVDPQGTGEAALLYQAAQQSAAPDWGAKYNLYHHPRHQWAEYVLKEHSTGGFAASIFSNATISPLAEQKITYLYGMGANHDETFVTNSALTPKPFEEKTRVLIEDQPDVYGDLTIEATGVKLRDSDFYRTHSITLILDSLAVINLFQKVDPTLAQHQIESIIAAGSNQRATRYPIAGAPTAIEANSLERALDSLHRLILGTPTTPLAVDGSPDGFGNATNRDAFYERIAAIENALDARSGPPLQIVELQAMEWEQVFSLATIKGLRTTPLAHDPSVLASVAGDELAYRYALRELVPFVIVGDDSLYEPFNQHGELDLVDPETGEGLTDAYLRDRAELALSLFERNVRDAGYITRASGQSALYEARVQGGGDAIGVAATVGTLAAARLQGADEMGNNARDAEVLAQMTALVRTGGSTYVGFGANGDDGLVGGSLDDRIYGGAGNDRLEGGGGDDTLLGGAGNDTLDIRDGNAGDKAIGGIGFDTFTADWGDTVADTPEAGSGGVIFVGADRLQLGGGSREEGEAFFEGAGGIKYWEGGGRVIAYAPDGTNPLRIEAPDAEVPGTGTDGDTIISGRPDLGIRLVTHRDPSPKSSPDGAIPGLWDKARTWHPVLDPLALDLDGNGFQTVSALDGGVRFDHEGNGVRSGTGWLAGGDAWVVLDRDGDGLIASGNELFGNETQLPGGALARDGFAALAPLDTNGDRVVNALDAPLTGWQVRADIDGDGFVLASELRAAAFADLRLWHDANLNGVSEPFELSTVEEAGVAAIRVDASVDGRTLAGGNRLISTASFIRVDGSSGTAGALDLVREPFFREYTDPPSLVAAGSEGVNVRGSGRVRDLEEAAAESADVRQALSLATAATTRAGQRAAVEDLLLAWADSSAMLPGTLAALGRPDRPVVQYGFDDLVTESPGNAYLAMTGGGVDPASLAPGWFAARQGAEYQRRVARIEALERFVGHTFIDVARAGASLQLNQNGVQLYALQASLRGENRAYLEDAWSSLVDYAYGAIATQTRLAPYMEAFARGAAARDFTEVEAMLVARRSGDPAAALEDVVDLSRALGYQLVDRGWIGLPGLMQGWIREASGDPVLAPLLDTLGVKLRSGSTLAGRGTGDVLLSDGGSGAPPAGSMAVVSGDYGNDILFGGGAHPVTMLDGPGNDILSGGAENTEYRGGAGRDIILFGRGSGRDVLFPLDVTRSVLPGERDTLIFLPGVAPADVRVRRTAGVTGALELQIAGSGDVFSDQWFAWSDLASGTYRMLAEARFADGTIWDAAELRRRSLIGTDADEGSHSGEPGLRGYIDTNDLIEGRGGNDALMGLDGDDLLYGGAGADILEGSRGADLLDGGSGDDRLHGGEGVDTYVLARGGGRDTVFRGNHFTFLASPFSDLDVVRAAEGIAPADVLLQRSSNSLRIFLADGSAELLDTGNPANPLYVNAGGVGPGIGRIEFDDGTVWDGAQIRARSLLGATAAADTIFGFDDTADAIRGLGGDDNLRGLARDDTLDGGRGNDTLAGGTGADAYLYRRGDGEDRVHYDLVSEMAGDELRLLDLNRADVYRESGVLRVIGGGSVSGASGVAAVVFADGSRGSFDSIAGPPAPEGGPPPDPDPGPGPDPDPGPDPSPIPDDGFTNVFGTPGDDVLSGGPGIHVFFGGEGTDTYVFRRGDGIAAIVDEETGADRTLIRFGPGIAPADLALEAGEEFSILRVGLQGDILAFTGGVSALQFDSGETLSLSALLSAPLPPAPPPPMPLPSAPPQEPEVTAAATAAVTADTVPRADAATEPVAETAASAPAPVRTNDSPPSAPLAVDAPPQRFASETPPAVRTSSDPVYREIDARLDVLLQAGRTNLSERYAQAVQEFERRRTGVTEPASEFQVPAEELGQWNEAIHAWHAQHPSFDTGHAEAQDGVWASRWGGVAGGGASLDELLAATGRPAVGNPHALRSLSGVQPAPGLGEGFTQLRG